jgi:hypothetical protein
MALVNRGANPLPQSSFALFAGASPSDIDTFGGAKDGTFHDRPDSGVQKVTFLGPDGVLALQPLASIPDLAQFITNNLLASVMTGNVFPIGPYGLYIHTHNGYAGITWAKGEFPVTALPVNPDEGSVPILTRSHSQHVTNMLPYAVQVRLSPQELEDAKRSLSGLQTVQLSVAKQIDASVKTTLCTIAMSAFSEVPDAIRAASVAQQSPLHLWSPVTFFHALKRVHGCASRGDGAGVGAAAARGAVPARDQRDDAARDDGGAADHGQSRGVPGRPGGFGPVQGGRSRADVVPRPHDRRGVDVPDGGPGAGRERA